MFIKSMFNVYMCVLSLVKHLPTVQYNVLVTPPPSPLPQSVLAFSNLIVCSPAPALYSVKYSDKRKDNGPLQYPSLENI